MVLLLVSNFCSEVNDFTLFARVLWHIAQLNKSVIWPGSQVTLNEGQSRVVWNLHVWVGWRETGGGGVYVQNSGQLLTEYFCIWLHGGRTWQSGWGFKGRQSLAFGMWVPKAQLTAKICLVAKGYRWKLKQGLLSVALPIVFLATLPPPPPKIIKNIQELGYPGPGQEWMSFYLVGNPLPCEGVTCIMR